MMIRRKLHHLLRSGRITDWPTFQRTRFLAPLQTKETTYRGKNTFKTFKSGEHSPTQFANNASDVFDRQGAYEGHGKTTVNLLNKENAGFANMIDSFAVDGFRLNSDTKIFGPCIVFPNHVLGWRVRGHEDITEEALCLFKLLDPKIDLLVVGYGEQLPKPPVSPKLILKMKSFGINMEVFPTEQAIPVYNFLVEEGRMVAAALIPPGRVSLVDGDIVKSKQRHNIIYGDIDKNYLGQDKPSGRVPLDPYETISLWRKDDPEDIDKKLKKWETIESSKSDKKK